MHNQGSIIPTAAAQAFIAFGSAPKRRRNVVYEPLKALELLPTAAESPLKALELLLRREGITSKGIGTHADGCGSTSKGVRTTADAEVIYGEQRLLDKDAQPVAATAKVVAGTYALEGAEPDPEPTPDPDVTPVTPE